MGYIITGEIILLAALLVTGPDDDRFKMPDGTKIPMGTALVASVFMILFWPLVMAWGLVQLINLKNGT